MVTVIYGISTYECFAASRTDHDIFMYDENWKVIEHISNVHGEEWNYVFIQNGEWADPAVILSEEERLNARLNQMQADLDYCLMLLDE